MYRYIVDQTHKHTQREKHALKLLYCLVIFDLLKFSSRLFFFLLIFLYFLYIYFYLLVVLFVVSMKMKDDNSAPAAAFATAAPKGILYETGTTTTLRCA